MKWLTAVPLALVRACTVMLPRLQAEESLLEAERTTLAVGRYSQRGAEQLFDVWLRAASPETVQERRARARTADGLPDIAGIGIGVRVVAHG